MADNTEDVKYSFQGDVKSLKQATETAIQLLDSYQKVVAKAVASGKFSASAKSTQTFNNAINKTIKDVEKMAAKLKKVGDVQLPTGSATSKAFESTMATVAKQMSAISDATKITTKNLTQLKTELNATRASLTGTSGQVDKLVASEQRFQNVLGAVQAKTQKFRDTMGTMKSKMGSAFDPVTNRVKSLSGVFDNIKSKVQSFKDKTTESFSRVGTLASTVASAFRRTSSEADKGDASSGRFAKALEKVSNVFSKLKSGASKTSSLFGTLLTKLGSLNTQASRTSASFRSLHSTTNLLSKAFTALAGVKIGDWLADATKQSISYIENLNLFEVAMGDAVDEGLAFVDTMQEIYGMDPSNIMRYAGNFYQLATAIEMPDEAATNLSLVLTKASNDIASLFNMDIETVFENMSSGIQGMSRAVRKYGMDIRVSTLQTEALALGITDQVESMSEANRMGLRFLVMMKQASNASGDFARNIETPANQLRIFKEQMAQLGRAVGNFFIGPLGTAIAYLNGFIMALRAVLTFIGDLVGIITGFADTFDPSGAEKEANAIAGIGDAAGGAAKKMKDLIAPFDELNVLQDTSADGGGGGGGGFGSELMDPRIAEAIEEMEYKFEDVKMKANQVRDAILEFFGFEVDMGKIISWDPAQFEENLINKFPQWTKTIQAAFDEWSNIIAGFKNVFSALGEVFEQVKIKFLNFLSIFINDETVSNFIYGLADSLNMLATWISEHSEGLADFVLLVSSLWLAFKAYTGISALLEPLTTFIATCANAIAPFATAVAVIAGVIAAIILLYDNSMLFADSFDNLVSTVVASIQSVFKAVTGLLKNIWQGIQQLWADHIQPLLEQTGDALAPVLDTISVLWTYTAQIITNATDLIGALWNTVLMPVFAALIDAISSVMRIVRTLWSKVLGPVIEYIAADVSGLWASTLQPIIQKIIEIVGGVIEIVLALWNNVLAPVLNWLITVLGPSIKNLINTIWSIVSGLFGSIGGIIDGLLTALKGVIDFLAGVFTGDWKRAWQGIVNIFIGLGNAIISAFEFCVNAVIGLINGMISLVYNAVIALINAILGAVNWVASLLSIDLDLNITAPPPAIPTQRWGRIPELATGGVVSSPTTAMIGEGTYSEAVIPLDDSPQMQELIRKIADAVDKDDGGGKSVDVRVYIGDREWDAFTYESSKRGEKLVGAQPIKIGG